MTIRSGRTKKYLEAAEVAFKKQQLNQGFILGAWTLFTAR